MDDLHEIIALPSDPFVLVDAAVPDSAVFPAGAGGARLRAHDTSYRARAIG